MDKTQEKEPSFGSANNSPPSWFARIPTKFIWECGRRSGKRRPFKRPFNMTDFMVFGVLAAHANNQGITFVGQQRIAKVLMIDKADVSRSIKKSIKAGYINVISRQRSQWKGVYGNVYRIVYDHRLSDDEIMDSFAKTPARDRDENHPVQETDVDTIHNHETENPIRELVDKSDVTKRALALARWYVTSVKIYTGQFKVVNERAVRVVEPLLQDGWTDEELKSATIEILEDKRQRGYPAPENLAFLRRTSRSSK